MCMNKKERREKTGERTGEKRKKQAKDTKIWRDVKLINK